jgi:hypothetical protein
MFRDDKVLVERFPSRLEAELAAGLLEAEGIPAYILADDAGGAYPVLQVIRGVQLLVSKEDAPKARRFLWEWRQAREVEGPSEED